MKHSDCLCGWAEQTTDVTAGQVHHSTPPLPPLPPRHPISNPMGRGKAWVGELQLSPMLAELMLSWDPQSIWVLTAWLLGGWHHLLRRTQVPGHSLAQHKDRQEGISRLLGAVCKTQPKQWPFLLLTQRCGFQNPPWQDTCVLLAAEETCTSSCHPWKSTNTWISPEILRSSFLPGACVNGSRR